MGRFVHWAAMLAPHAVRRLLGVRPCLTASGCAYMASACARLAAYLPQDAVRRAAAANLQRMHTLRIPGGGWGLPFPWHTSPTQTIPAHTTLAYTTYTALQALEDDALASGRPARLAEAAACWKQAAAQLNWIEYDGQALASYSRYDRYEVINTNALLGGLLARLGAATGDEELRVRARGMLHFACAEQRQDGSWPYFSARTGGRQPTDSYHTAMTLRGLALGRAAGGAECDTALERGLAFYAAHFVSPRGRPQLWIQRPWPIDVACVSEAVQMGAALAEAAASPRVAAQARGLARRTLNWAMRHCVTPDGCFAYRLYPGWCVRLDSVRWNHGMMLLAIADALRCERDG
jgi:hypothetical protein